MKESDAGVHLHNIREEFQKNKAFMKGKAEGLNHTTQVDVTKTGKKKGKLKEDNAIIDAQYQKGTVKGSLKRKKQDLEDAASKPGNQELKTQLAGMQDMQPRKRKLRS